MLFEHGFIPFDTEGQAIVNHIDLTENKAFDHEFAIGRGSLT
jgi:hypothetical protein